MSTGNQFVHLSDKKLLGVTSYQERFFGYLKSKMTEIFAAVWSLNGTFDSGGTPINFSFSAGQLTIDDGTGTDGSGHILVVGATEKNVAWDRADECHVGLHYTERPVGIQINPRSGLPEYQDWKEIVGVSAEPDSVSVVSGHLRLDISSLVGESAVSFAGRQCLVWRNTPSSGALTEAIAIEQCTVAFSTNNYIDTTGMLGASAAGDANLYTVCLLGPTIRSDVDLSTVPGYWYLGVVSNDGGFDSDVDGQRVIRKSLSDLLEYLVYSNVVNTFTRGQQIDPTVNEYGIDVTGGATGGAAHAAINAVGGMSMGNAAPAIIATAGNANASAIVAVGKGAAPALDVSCDGSREAIIATGGTDGDGIVAQGGTGTYRTPAGITTTGGATNGPGGVGYGVGSGAGFKGYGGAGAGPGGLFYGGTYGGRGIISYGNGIGAEIYGGTNSEGAIIQANGTGNGLEVTAGATGKGGYFEGGATANGGSGEDVGAAIHAKGGATGPGGGGAAGLAGFFEGGFANDAIHAIADDNGEHSGIDARGAWGGTFTCTSPSGGCAAIYCSGNTEGNDGGKFHGSDAGTAQSCGIETTGGNAGPGIKSYGGYDGGDGIQSKGGISGGNGGYFEARGGSGNGIIASGFNEGHGGQFTSGDSSGAQGIHAECLSSGANAHGGEFHGGSYGAAIHAVHGTNGAPLFLSIRSGIPSGVQNGYIWLDSLDNKMHLYINSTEYKIDMTAV